MPRRSERQGVGVGLLAGGVLMTLMGVASMVVSGDTPQITSSTSTTESRLVTTGAIEPTTTTDTTPTPTPTTTTSTATTTVTTTASPTSTTSTTSVTSGAIAGFVTDFVAAIDSGDVDFLVDTLHPVVFSLFDRNQCRDFVQDEILALEGYHITGVASGPTTQQIADVNIDVFSVPVEFRFRGVEFTSDATYAFENDEVRWFTQCGS